jgi:hypothetical protein
MRFCNCVCKDRKPVLDKEEKMRAATIFTVVGLSLFAVSTGAFAQDMNGMNGNSMGPKTMTHKSMTKKQRMMMQKQQMMKKQQTQHNM